MNIVTRLKLRSLKKKALAMVKKRQENAVSDAELTKEIALHAEITALYDKHKTDKKSPNAELLAIESLRIAAQLGDANAQYELGRRLLEKGKFWDEVKASYLANDIHDKYAKDCYDEAFLFLRSAQEQSQPLAKRLHGMAYINAWGVERDEDKGFKMVIDSIDMEGSWEKATEIFKELGLNKPEFFNKVMQYRQTGK